MHADRKPGLLRGLVNRPVTALAERLDVTAEQQHLDKILVAGTLTNFLGGRQAVLVADHDRTLQAGILAGPFVGLPAVECRADGPAPIMVATALPGGERVNNVKYNTI